LALTAMQNCVSSSVDSSPTLFAILDIATAIESSQKPASASALLKVAVYETVTDQQLCCLLFIARPH
jgi:hypothetical protein